MKQLIAAFAVLMAAGVGSFFLIAPPTGKEFVVFASGTAATISDDFDLWRVSLDGSGLRKLTTDYRGISMATVSKDGKTIVFCGRLETVAGLYAIDERGDITQLTSARMFAESVPTFHPDGNTLVFQEAVSDKVVNIMELDMLSGGKTPLIANGFINRDPCISPDGRKIVYVSNVSGTFRLYVADIDGKNARAIRRLRSRM